MDKNEIKKDLYKSKEMASFSHYIAGNLYYTVKVGFDLFQFPIPTVEEGPTFNNDESDLSMYEVETVMLSSDLGTTSFSRDMLGKSLIRWIDMAIDNGEFVMIETAVSPV